MKLKLKDLGKIVTGFTPKKKEKDAWGEDIPFLTPSDYGLDRFAKTSRFLSDEWVSQRKSKIVSCPSISVTCIGSDMGKTVFNDVNIITNQQINSIYNIKTDLVSPLYLYYLLKSKREYLHFLGSGNGSTMPILNKRDFSNIEVELPSLKQQTQISNMLDVLDKKIELNNSINANLDELMSEIFERYVTEANVFTTDSLSNIANYKNGLAMQRFRPNGADKGLPVLKIKELNQGFTDSSSDRCSSKISNDVIVKTGDIIFSWSGTLIVKIWTGTTCGLNQHLFKVTSDKYPKWFIYKWTEYYLRQFQSIAAGKATTMGHIKRSDLKQAEVKIPHKSEIDRLDKLISPIFKRYVNNILEINSLKELKNELLSKIF